MRQWHISTCVLLVLSAMGLPFPAFAQMSGWMAAQAPGDPSTYLLSDRSKLTVADLAVGTTVKLGTDVNLRFGPAYWNGPRTILKRGTYVSIAEIKKLSTKTGEIQVWLRVDTIESVGPPAGGAGTPTAHNSNLQGIPDAAISVPSAAESADYAAACKAGLDLQVAAQQAAGVAPEDRDLYTDPDGLIVHRKEDGSCDGGDTAQREGWYWLGVWLRAHTPRMKPWPIKRKLNFEQVMRLLEPHGDGVFYRHPKLAPWNNPTDKEWGTSRDQLTPIIAALGVWNATDTLHRLWSALPYDIVGKHAFNGDWRNFLGQDGWNCTEIQSMDCSAVGDCSPREDTRSCDLQTDNRDCSLQVDNRDCSAGEDTRDCSTGLGINDPICEAAKAAQNVIYAGQKAACETSKSTQNAAYGAQKLACEAQKTGQNELYAAQKLSCETGKAGQNALYAGEKVVCEAGKSGGKGLCEATKAIEFQLCRLSNVYSGDLMGPESVAMYRRGIGEDPMIPNLDDLLTLVGHSELGDAESLVNTGIRISASSNPDDTGDDLNHIVAALISERRFPSGASKTSTVAYAAGRKLSYGSYLGEYYKHFGNDLTDITSRIQAGIAAGWKPDASAIYGAIKWYHRPATGANPALAKLYEPIIAWYFYGPGLVIPAVPVAARPAH